jgi:LacI family transcriptional regulator
MSKLLKLDPRQDGVFCYNDPIGVGALDTILGAGLRVPEDVAVIGCGNLQYDKSLRVPLSSVDQQSAAIGERAAKLALSLIQARTPLRPKSIILEARVVPRVSTQRKPTS